MHTGNREDVVLWENLHTIPVQESVCMSETYLQQREVGKSS